MAIALDTTISGEFANSWASLEYADLYFENHPVLTKRNTWASATDESKTVALIQACNMLNALKMTGPYKTPPPLGVRMTYGNNWPKVLVDAIYPADPYQALQLPRNIDYSIEDPNTFYIPEAALMAQCEQAVYLMTFDESALSNQRQGIFRDGITAEGISLAQGYNGKGDAYAPMAISYIRTLLLGRNNLNKF